MALSDWFLQFPIAESQSVGYQRLLCQSQYLGFRHDSDGRSAIHVSDAFGRCDASRVGLRLELYKRPDQFVL